jgi:HPt (histidine-containing phosphotransfer) domain-containing protein
MPVNETPLNSAIFDQLRLAMAGDPVGLADLYRDYLADAWQSFQVLRENVVKREFSTVRAKAHQLKGSSLILGAHGVAHYATLLENGAIEKNLADAGAALEGMQTTLRDVQLELVNRLGPRVLPAGETAA